MKAADVDLGGLGPKSKQQTWVLEAWPQSESSRRGFSRLRPKVKAADVGFGGLAPK